MVFKISNFFVILVILSFPLSSNAEQGIIPRFVSLKVSEANIRTGPGVKFPIKWILVKNHLPLEILDHFDNWYKVRDEEQKEGWVHKNLISSKRFFVVSEDQTLLYKNPKRNYVLYSLEAGVRGRIRSCRNKWCEVEIDNINGWIDRSKIWGVYSHEVL